MQGLRRAAQGDGPNAPAVLARHCDRSVVVASDLSACGRPRRNARRRPDVVWKTELSIVMESAAVKQDRRHAPLVSMLAGEPATDRRFGVHAPDEARPPPSTSVLLETGRTVTTPSRSENANMRLIGPWIMNILVIGSTGPQGREFVAQALGAGHAVRALARNPSALRSAPSLEVVRGDVFDPPSLDAHAAVHGQDAAVVILGVSFAAARKPTNVFSQGTRNLITALKAAGVRRLIVVGSFGFGDSGRDAGILERVFFALVVGGVRGQGLAGAGRSRERPRLHHRSPDPLDDGLRHRPLHCTRRPWSGPFANCASRRRPIHLGCAPHPRVRWQDGLPREARKGLLRPRLA